MSNISIILYLPNRPDLAKYKSKRILKNLKSGSIQDIIDKTSNHWRKIFSIFAKITFKINYSDVIKWQDYRDKELLSQNQNEIICFTSKLLESSSNSIHIISGKENAARFKLKHELFIDVDRDGLIKRYKNIYITPYFDY